MADEPTANDDNTMIQYGPNVRMDRIPTPAPDGTFRWIVYELHQVTDGRHPVSDKETTETEVWVPHGQGNEADARVMCEQLSGISG